MSNNFVVDKLQVQILHAHEGRQLRRALLIFKQKGILVDVHVSGDILTVKKEGSLVDHPTFHDDSAAQECAEVVEDSLRVHACYPSDSLPVEYRETHALHQEIADIEQLQHIGRRQNHLVRARPAFGGVDTHLEEDYLVFLEDFGPPPFWWLSDEDARSFVFRDEGLHPQQSVHEHGFIDDVLYGLWRLFFVTSRQNLFK